MTDNDALNRQIAASRDFDLQNPIVSAVKDLTYACRELTVALKGVERALNRNEPEEVFGIGPTEMENLEAWLEEERKRKSGQG